MRLLALTAILLAFPFLPSFAAEKESAYDRVMRTGTIRCGYGVWEPILTKDPNTGKLGGIFYEYMEALGKALSLKVEWTEEVGWGEFPAALNAGRFDAMCAGIWPTASRAREADFTIPVYYQGIYAYSRKDDSRFDHHLEKINDESVTISVMDGEMSAIIAKTDFFKAKTFEVPALSSQSIILVNVAEKKADITFTDIAGAQGFMSKNPGKIKQVPSDTPLRVFGNTLAVELNEQKLRRMLDNATIELLNSGVIEKIVRKHEKFPGSLVMPAKTYETSKP